MKKIWSISALADELGKDRRTVSRALSSVPPDGRKGRHPGWFLSTAVSAFDDRTKIRRQRNGVLETIMGRLAEWREIHREPSNALPIEMIAELVGVKVDTVLIWLRAGMPYAQVGDWETGKGFTLNLGWVAEWTSMVQGAADRHLPAPHKARAGRDRASHGR